ncbi:hypothetical protein ALI144C_24440 [Actinosynnema sp. ALI-1.44]|nr:hypothetical protein ALI144C_24440 [Actinosynnema sp. ALI-1.44]
MGLFCNALRDQSLLVVKTAIEGLIAVGDPRHAPRLVRYLDHELHSVQRVAATALHEWGWATDDVRRARVAVPLEAWTDVASLGAGAVAVVARSLAPLWACCILCVGRCACPLPNLGTHAANSPVRRLRLTNSHRCPAGSPPPLARPIQAQL